MFKEWENTYEKITQMVVPRSSVKISEDAEYGLFTVTVFRKVVDEYKHHAREKKQVSISFSLTVIIDSSLLAGLLFVTLNMMQRQWKRSERKKGNLSFN